MKSNFERYLDRILAQTEGSEAEKEDLFEEMMIHLELKREELINQGMTRLDAERKAIELFGLAAEIGDKIQQSFFPYRRELMLTLSIASFLYFTSLYLLALFAEGNAHIGWFVFSMISNSLLLFISLNFFNSFNRRRWINSLLILQIFVSLYGYAVVSAFEHTVQMLLFISNWLIIFLSLVLIYQTTIFETKGQFVKIRRRIHQIHFVTGIIIIGWSLFFISGGLWLFGGFHLSMILLMIPFVIWVLTYYGQLKLVHKYKKWAVLLAVLAVLINVSLFIWFMYPLF